MEAFEKDQLTASIVGRIADYRLGEIEQVDAGRVADWLGQFDAKDQDTVLRETDRLLRKTYVSRAACKTFIERLVYSEKLVGPDARAFWASLGFLRLQRSSRSQRDLLVLLEEVLREKYQLSTASSHSPTSVYLYLDDVCFSGNQVQHDLTTWAGENEIRNAKVHVVTIAMYRGGEYYAKQKLAPLRARNVEFNFWTAVRLENRKAYVKDSDVFWPTKLPDEEYVNAWRATFPEGEQYFFPRPPGGKGALDLFSSEDAREQIEQAFLKRGAFIHSLSQNPAPSMRPLGYSKLRTPGFGATLVTYRNCPNNAPLVFWWGDPEAGGPLNRWTPLLPRRIRANAAVDFDAIDF